MIQEYKDLLLKDLCTRLPYGVKVKVNSEYLSEELIKVGYDKSLVVYGITADGSISFTLDKGLMEYSMPILSIKPYLFPLSSMTEEQKKEYYSLADDVTIKPGQGSCLGIKIHCIKLGISDNPHEEVWDYIDLAALDWLNKNHFDYRGLIEKGLAIDATGLNIY